jgi:hypothetical protein
MKFNDRHDYTYEPELFDLEDTQVALKIQAEYVEAHAVRPQPRFLEVNRDPRAYDSVLHMPLSPRTQFSREIPLPAINYFDKNDAKMSRLGRNPQRADLFWLAQLHLIAADYFPQVGDVVIWNGHRLTTINVHARPDAYWQQTNVWLGLVVECIIAPEGDARPVLQVNHTAPAEQAPDFVAQQEVVWAPPRLVDDAR